MHRQRPHFRGFTLVELLVVIAILGVVISILLPSIASARAQSKYVVCRANLRTIGQLIQAYAQENNGRIPRGPTCLPQDYQLTLRNPEVATSQVWTPEYQQIEDCTAKVLPVGGEYMGLGLLTKKSGKAGNEFLYCPDDSALSPAKEAPRIGQPGVSAFSSYLYRQMDAMPKQVLDQGKLDDLQSRVYASPGSTPGGGSGSIRLEVQALALDFNSLGTGDIFVNGDPLEEHINHEGERLNVLYKDGSTKPFDNELQRVHNPPPVPWASIPASAFLSFPAGVTSALDRIFIAGDYSFVSEEPWRAPELLWF